MNIKYLNKLLDSVENHVSVLKDDHRDRLVAYLELHRPFDDFIDYLEHLFDVYVDKSAQKKLEPRYKKLVENS